MRPGELDVSPLISSRSRALVRLVRLPDHARAGGLSSELRGLGAAAAELPGAIEGRSRNHRLHLRQALIAECERRGWNIVRIIADEGYSAKDMRRPGVQEAIRALGSGEADALVVSKLDRLSRSMVDFSALMARAQKRGWALVALDCVDTTSPSGEAMANMLATFAQFERRLISQRTTDALAVKKAQGVQLGRPRVLPEEVRVRIRKMRDGGASLARIANALTDDGTPTAHGGRRWYPSTVSKVLAGPA